MNLKFAVISSLLLAAGCAQTQNGSPSVNLSMASLLNSAGLTNPATPTASQSVTQQDQIIGMQTDNTPLVGTPIAQTNLLDFFDNNPNAVAALTIKNIQRNDSWLADATLWYSSTKSETVRDVKICKSNDPNDAGKTACPAQGRQSRACSSYRSHSAPAARPAETAAEKKCRCRLA